jgi:hypothetical protein
MRPSNLGNQRTRGGKIRGAGLLLGAAVALVACDADDSTKDPSEYGFDERRTGLLAVADCDELLAYFRAEAVEDYSAYGYGAMRGGGVSLGIPEVANDATGVPGGEPQEPSEGTDFSGTNVQERGVDEPDLVKTDGRALYTVRNGRLLVYGAADLALQLDLPLPFSGTQLFLAGDRVLVLGEVWDGVPGVVLPETQRYVSRTGLLVVDVSDRANPRVELERYVDGRLVAARLTGSTARVVVHHVPNVAIDFDALPGMDSPGGGSSGGGSSGGGVAEPGTTVSPTPVEPAPPPAMGSEEQGLEEDDALRDALVAQLAQVPLESFLAQSYTVTAEGVDTRPSAACSDHHRPGERSGIGSTLVLSLDLANPTVALADPAVVTSSDVVYADGDGLYLSTTNARMMWAVGGVARGGDVAVGVSEGRPTSSEPSTEPAPSPEPLPDMGESEQGLEDAAAPDDREATQVHRLRFGASGEPVRYEASGRVHGSPLSSYAFSAHEGHLRVATTEHDFTGERRSVSRVTVLDGDLVAVGQTEDLAPGEEIFAVRFVGDTGYVVTFERKDPLFTIDLSNPAEPRVVGELEVPGYSTYLHPVDDTLLIGLGMDADENGFETGMQLSLFDVSDLSNPTRRFAHPLGQGYSNALYDPHAFLYWAPENLVALPVNAWVNDAPLDGLQLVRLDLESGFVDVGTISHDGLPETPEGVPGPSPGGGGAFAPPDGGDSAGEPVDPDGRAGAPAEDAAAPLPPDEVPPDGRRFAHVERSLVIGDALYVLSDVGLSSHGLADFAERASASFPRAPHGDSGGQTPDAPAQATDAR